MSEKKSECEVNMISLAKIAEALDCKFYGNGDLICSSPSEPNTAKEDQLALAIDDKYMEQLFNTQAKVAIIGKNIDWHSRGLEGVIVAKNSKLVLAKINDLFNSFEKRNRVISTNSTIPKDALIGLNPSIGSYVTIDENVKIGDNATIENGVSIGANVTIGNNCFIKSGCRIEKNVWIGNSVICHQNVVLGSDGFSFTPHGGESIFDRLDKNHKTNVKKEGFQRVASVGGVLIGDDVEIGANTCVDKGTLKNTVIGSGSKLDNLVHIAHNVIIGENCIICGQVGIAGSTIVGDDVIMGGQVGVADNLIIGHSSILAGKTGVSVNVSPNKFMMGNPAMEMTKNVQSYKALRRLPRLQKKVSDLTELVNKILLQMENK